jgi:hypothetical protein
MVDDPSAECKHGMWGRNLPRCESEELNHWDVTSGWKSSRETVDMDGVDSHLF